MNFIIFVRIVFVRLVVELQVMFIIMFIIVYELHFNLFIMSMFPGQQRAANVSDESDSQRINSVVDSKESKIYASQKLAKFFELEVTLKVFGKVIWNWRFPPQN